MTIKEEPLTGSASKGTSPSNGTNGAYVHNRVLTTTQFNVLGTRPIRPDGVDKVTGRAIYGGDVRLTGMLQGKVLRSPHVHARIRSIDTSRALALPGVKAVVTAGDLRQAGHERVEFAEGGGDVRFMQDNILARDKVLYKGHAVAAVAAVDAHTAEAALKLIDVDYEALPAVVDVREAMMGDAPLVHEDLTTKSLGQPTEKHSNVAEHFQFVLGDPETAFREADVVVERVVTTTMVHQGYIEPHNATAMWNADGQVTVWSSTQGGFGVRDQCAQILQYPVSKIKAVPTEIGGGFGGKLNVYLEPVAALLSRASGRPVQLVMTRAEVLQASGPAPGCWLRVKIGALRDGRFVAAEAEMAFEAGAFPGSNVGEAAECIFACYDIPNGRIDGYDVVVNRPKTTPYRAPGAPQAAFATEQVVDEIAERLGIDPLELRIMNSAREGTRKIDGPVFKRIGSLETLRAAYAHEHYKTPLGQSDGLTPRRRGRGVAHGYWFNIGGPSSCTISVNEDGTVSLVEGSPDIGGSRASIAMQAAEVLGIQAGDVKPAVGDTDSIGFTDQTGGSRTTYATGLAAYTAAQDVIQQMKARAAFIWEVDPESVTFEDGVFSTTAGGDAARERRFTFAELSGQLSDTGGPVTGRGNVDPPGRGGAFATNIVDVDVDPETGKVQILRFTVVQDAGKAIHPSYVEGQMQGGSVQGIGWALNEEYVLNTRGEMVNASLLDYRMPTAYDLPMIDTVIVEVPNPGHPFGVRGVGEVPIVPPPGAVANAIYHAIGVRMDRLPMSPRTILESTGRI